VVRARVGTMDRQLLQRGAARIRRVLLLACLVLGAPLCASAQSIPWRDGTFDLQAVNEPLNVFLTRILTLQGISTTMSPSVSSGRVNGRFKGQASTVFRGLVETYGLAWFYDGTTLEICSLGELETRLLEVDPADVGRLERTLRQFRLSDPRYPLRVSPADGQILVSGPPRFVEMVVGVADRVSQTPTKLRTGVDVRVFRLRYARAADTIVSIGGVDTQIAGVARVLNELVGDVRMEAAAPARSSPRNLAGLRGKGLIAVGRGDTATAAAANGQAANNFAVAAALANNDAANPAGNAYGGANAGDIGANRSLRDPSSPRMLATARADARINAVIVRDSPERMPMYTKLIESLDIDVPLIEIEASVIDVSDDKSQQLGIDWRAHGSRFDVVSSPNGLAGTGTGQTNLANDLLRSGDPISAGSGLVGTLIFGSGRSYFLARLNALTELGDARTVSKPRVLTIDNTEAVLQNTSEFFVRVAGERQVDLFNVTLGLSMRVTPTVIEDALGRRIKMIVRIEDGNTNSGQRVDNIPVVNRNAISTQAVVGDGQSLLIGGYIIEESANGRSGVPGLSNVPVLGWLFGQRTTTARRVERIFMLTPRLVALTDLPRSTPADARPASEPGVLTP
jgi:type III secretion protein C